MDGRIDLERQRVRVRQRVNMFPGDVEVRKDAAMSGADPVTQFIAHNSLGATRAPVLSSTDSMTSLFRAFVRPAGQSAAFERHADSH